MVPWLGTMTGLWLLKIQKTITPGRFIQANIPALLAEKYHTPSVHISSIGSIMLQYQL